MVVKPIDKDIPDETTLASAARLIEAGAVVIFPSDSCYGMATSATKPEAIERLYKIKQRPADKEISLIFRNLDQVKQWAYVDQQQEKILTKNLPGPFTFILQAKPEAPFDSQSVGVRIPDNTLTRALSNLISTPFTATSANISELPSCYSVEEIQRQFSNKIYQPDLILDAGKLPQYPPSTVVDIRQGRRVILREGVARVRY